MPAQTKNNMGFNLINPYLLELINEHSQVNKIPLVSYELIIKLTCVLANHIPGRLE